MNLSTIRGVQVAFPYTPYEVQRVLMERAIEALQTNSNALLESPTGTGKSLSLLCASLAWQKSAKYEGGVKPLVIYASRTHLQLQQVGQELKKTAYASAGGAITMSSRENSCVHSRVGKLKSGEQISHCKQLVAAKQCPNRQVAQTLARRPDALPDIEDLNLHASPDGRCCAYYFPRDVMAHNSAEVNLVFMPYNYLMDQSSRRGLKIAWERSIVIIDEAHNIGEVCEDAYSFSLGQSQLAGAVAELNGLIKLFASQPPQNATTSMSAGELGKLKATLQGLGQAFAQCASNSKTSTSQLLLPVFASQGIGFSSAPGLLQQLDMCLDALSQAHSSSKFLDYLIKCLAKVFDQDASRSEQDQQRLLDEFYRCVFDREEEGNGGWRVHLWCFSPSLAFRDLQQQLGIRSILVASGTLSPLDSFAAGLKIPFPIRLESPHVVAKERVFLGCLSTGVTGRKLNGSFHNRSSESYQTELGNTLVVLATMIPDGVLVFFSSYSAMQSCLGRWKQCGVWERLGKHKHALVVEQRGNGGSHADDLTGSAEEYDSALRTGGGAMMFAVCRGKASEGMDFRDKRARGVIIIGLPFPSSQDAKVQHKRAYLDQTGENGSAWYASQAYRAVNQAIGRAIRHEKDYGAIILLDERFSTYANQLSLWLRPCFQHFDQGPKQAIPQLVQFFKRYKTEPVPPPLSLPPPPSVRAVATTSTPYSPPAPKAPRLEASRFAVTHSDKESGAKFCAECRQALTSTQYLEFKQLLRDYNAHKQLDVAPTLLNHRAIQLFANVSDSRQRLHLLQSLCSFLPGRIQNSLRAQVKQVYDFM
ncbi:hypothetical protein BASA81_012149 [Batrachochytrium salamandrivorans]|nr:hypothetical protein BASA81_012149 [Batrachochytrium salamandrivorans]